MDLVEPIRRLAEKATGIGIPSPDEALARVRASRAVRLRFRDDGYVPNNPRLPLLHYRRAVRFNRTDDPAAVLEKIFNINGWGAAWRNGVYGFVHYHSMIHEVLGIAKGSATLRLGGNKGRTVKVGAGDVIIIPAGVGHECLQASPTFLAVGVDPATGTYDECRGSFQERAGAMEAIRRVGVPKQHPLYGSRLRLW